MNQSDIINELKEQIDIVDIISEYVTLKKAGHNYKGLCPFHQEKTPSFTVNPSRQIYYCFGCHKGGDVINFVMSYHNLTFMEAIQNLSDKAGVSIQKFQGVSTNKEVFYRIYRLTCDYFKENLKSHKKALEYFQKRGIDSQMIENYELGYSPQGRDSLFQYLINKGFDKEVILKSSLVNTSKGQYFDFFRDRIMFPILDNSERVIAFGGRRLSDNNTSAKYINSAETPIFKKGDTLFGLNKARGEIAKKNYSILVEGYMDVLTCHQFGFLNVIAPLGTALTSSHLQRLKKISPNIVLLFDGDNAGINAAKRAIELSFMSSLFVKIVILPNTEDPDSVLRNKGKEELKKLLSMAISPVAFYFKLFGKNVVECTRNLLNLILLTEDLLQREVYIKEIADKTNMSESILRQEIDRLIKKKEKKHPSTKKNTDFSQETIMLDKLDEYILMLIVSKPYLLNRITCFDINLFEDKLVRDIFQKIILINEAKSKTVFSSLMAMCNDAEKNVLIRIGSEMSLDDDTAKEAIEDCINKITLRMIDKNIRFATEKNDLVLLNNLIEQRRKLSLQHGKI